MTPGRNNTSYMTYKLCIGHLTQMSHLLIRDPSLSSNAKIFLDSTQSSRQFVTNSAVEKLLSKWSNLIKVELPRLTLLPSTAPSPTPPPPPLYSAPLPVILLLNRVWPRNIFALFLIFPKKNIFLYPSKSS